MRTRSLAVLGIAAYAIFLVATIPASVVASRIAAASNGLVQVAAPSGTLWSGDARATVLGPGGIVTLDRIHWRFAPGGLAAGHIAFDVAAGGRGLDAKLTLGRGFSRWYFGAADARIDASIAAAFAPLLGPTHPEGVVTVATRELRLKDDGAARGALSATWSGAAVSLSDVKPLGRYALEATAEDGPVSFTIATKDGPLRVSGHGTFSPSGQVAFSGEARADGDQARALEPLLDLLGPRRPDGAREIRIQR